MWNKGYVFLFPAYTGWKNAVALKLEMSSYSRESAVPEISGARQEYAGNSYPMVQGFLDPLLHFFL